jgi:hypothetical protein
MNIYVGIGVLIIDPIRYDMEINGSDVNLFIFIQIRSSRVWVNPTQHQLIIFFEVIL